MPNILETTNCTLYIANYNCCSKFILYHVAMHILAMIKSFELRAMCIHDGLTQAMIKYTRLSLSLLGRACKQGYFSGVCVCSSFNYVSADGPELPFNVFKKWDNEKTSPFPRKSLTACTRSRQVNKLVLHCKVVTSCNSLIIVTFTPILR